MNICCEPEAAERYIDDAIRVRPGDPAAFFFYTMAALGQLQRGNLTEACNLAMQSARIYDGWDTTYRVLGSALAQLGRIDEAHAAVEKLRELAPVLTVSGLRERWPLRKPEVLERILDGPRTAGVPE